MIVTKLKGRFRTSYEVLDCMEPIRYSEYISGTDHMTTFNDDQVAICKTCDIEPPAECLTSTAREQWRKATKPKKRGRKPGSKNKKTF